MTSQNGHIPRDSTSHLGRNAEAVQLTGPVYQDTPGDRLAAFERGRALLEMTLRGEPCPWHFDGRILRDTQSDRVLGVTLYAEPFEAGDGKL